MPEFRYVGLGALLAKAQAAVDAAKDDTAERVVELAQEGAPVLTGQLAGSVHREGDMVVASTEYAGYVEEGTSDTAAVPFMEQAAMAARPEAERAMAEHAREEF